jgi:hypothetical protein
MCQHRHTRKIKKREDVLGLFSKGDALLGPDQVG